MAVEAIEINPVGANLLNPVLPMGRLVAGHPMVSQVVVDDTTKQPKLGKDMQPQHQTYFGFAIPKAGEQHWNQTAWGRLIWEAGSKGFPRGEFNNPSFAWKIVDGDSVYPNKNGTIPSEQEGYPGHWVLNLSTLLASIQCVSSITGKACATDKEIKKGDYGRVTLIAKANCDQNGMAKTPGVYLNPTGFCIDKQGEEIISKGSVNVDTSAAFGVSSMGSFGSPAPVNTQVQAPQVQAPQVQAPQVQAPQVQAPAPVQPNTTFLKPPAPSAPPAEVKRMYQGAVYTEAQLRANNWPEATIQSLPIA